MDPTDTVSRWARRVATLKVQAGKSGRGGTANDLTEEALSLCDELVRELAGAMLTHDRLRGELRASEAAWQQLFDTMPSAGVVTDRSSLILSANRAASVLLNVSAAHLKERSLLVFSQDRETFRALLAELDHTHSAELRARLMLRPRERKATMMQLRVVALPGRDSAWLWILAPAPAADTIPSLEVASPAGDGPGPVPLALD